MRRRRPLGLLRADRSSRRSERATNAPQPRCGAGRDAEHVELERNAGRHWQQGNGRGRRIRLTYDEVSISPDLRSGFRGRRAWRDRRSSDVERARTTFVRIPNPHVAHRGGDRHFVIGARTTRPVASPRQRFTARATLAVVVHDAAHPTPSPCWLRSELTARHGEKRGGPTHHNLDAVQHGKQGSGGDDAFNSPMTKCRSARICAPASEGAVSGETAGLRKWSDRARPSGASRTRVAVTPDLRSGFRGRSA